MFIGLMKVKITFKICYKNVAEILNSLPQSSVLERFAKVINTNRG